MQRVDFHCHTIFSKDSLAPIEKVISACHKKGITRLVITDHNTNAGALKAYEIDPGLIIIGEEIKTQQGELLAFFVKELIPPGLPAFDAITLLRQQGAFISVSHPFDELRNGHWAESDLIEITPLIDAIETFNSRCFTSEFNRKAQAFAQKHNLLGTVGSDAHAIFEIGRATQRLPEFHDADTLKIALATATADAILSSPWVHFTSRYAVWRKNASTS